MAFVEIGIAFATRLLLVMLFMPFSALDKILDFSGAKRQAQEAVSSSGAATAMVAAGACVEIFMSAGVLTGTADRAAALVLAGYCGLTALLWKQFWRPGDFWALGDSKARGLFWDFWKNLALAGGFLLITFGTSASTVTTFLNQPFSSTHPYSVARGEP